MVAWQPVSQTRLSLRLSQPRHQRPATSHLVSFGRYYLDDPDGLQEKINTAALAGEDLQYRDLNLTFRGQMLGAGHYFTASYPQ